MDSPTLDWPSVPGWSVRHKRPDMTNPSPSPVFDPTRFYDAAALRDALGASDMTLRRWQASGRLPPHVQLGGPRGRRLWSGRDLNEHLASAPRGRAAVRGIAMSAAG